MDLARHWRVIGKVVEQATKQHGFCTFATVNQDGSPRLAPIGSLILGEPGKAVFFESFPETTRRNLERDPRVCVLAVAGGLRFWLASLFRGRFGSPPGVRLTGLAGPRRPATSQEQAVFHRRVRLFRGLAGYKLLWSKMREVREITFDSFEPLRLGVMGRGLWGEGSETP